MIKDILSILAGLVVVEAIMLTLGGVAALAILAVLAAAFLMATENLA